MISRGMLTAALAAALAAGGCHTMYFETGDIPVEGLIQAGAPPAQVREERKSYFFWGLTPHRTIDIREKCPQGALAVMEETTFLDGLGDLVTLGIWAPRSSTYYCRASGAEVPQ